MFNDVLADKNYPGKNWFYSIMEVPAPLKRLGVSSILTGTTIIQLCKKWYKSNRDNLWPLTFTGEYMLAKPIKTFSGCAYVRVGPLRKKVRSSG